MTSYEVARYKLEIENLDSVKRGLLTIKDLDSPLSLYSVSKSVGNFYNFVE